MAFDIHTPRRSKRYQPLVDTAGSSNEGEERCTWIGSPIQSRESQVTDLHEEDSFDEDTDTETAFYEAFLRKKFNKQKVVEQEEFAVGDTVLVRTQAKLPSVGVIVAMWEVRAMDRSEQQRVYQKVKIHWFLRPTELPRVRAKRDHLENEVYFSLASTAILVPHAIIKHCTVTSTAPKSSASKQAKKNRTATLPQDEFYCNSAIDALRGLYYELDWDGHRETALEAADDVNGSSWIVTVVSTTRKRGGRKSIYAESSDEDADSGDEYEAPSAEEEGEEDVASDGNMSANDQVISDEEEDDDRMLCTPSKKRRRARQVATPRKSKRTKRTLAMPTPHSRAALRARAKSKRMAFKPAPQIAYDFMSSAGDNLPEDPWLRAMQVLHVGSRPDVLPCRDAEFLHILRAVEGLLEEGSGGCVYVSGVPGTGKTATVHRIVRELKRMAERNEANPFTYVEINGLKIPEASAAYSLLWEAVSGHDAANEGHLKISSKEALKQLTKFFGAGVRAGPAGHACIVLMDELDQLLTTKQEVVYNFFNWPTLVGSKLIVIAVANTHDLPERVMTGRVRSRLGMTRINYQPYDKAQLIRIVEARLQAAKEGFIGKFPEVITADGINFAAAKIASISGDARRVLDICRRAVELVRPSGKPAKIADVKEVITRMQSSLTAAYLGDCSLHERIMLASLIKCMLRDGVLEIKWDDVQRQHLIYTPVLAGDGDPTRKPSPTELRCILDGLLASHAVLIEDGSGAAAARRADGDRRIILNIEQTEVQRVLSEMGGQMWKNALGL
ncbi:P-loop containing nucleoside triphosphate hydrolase protein [Fomitiporia mediterranea MF3/22]|uniref:P-loop containing nucleoside triphosphate hydrolase protein n=1 Tax=Fomitiporia mediterranea (strain MF3/22) TaxID=694068 RepID=UPI0004409CDD|nr:P-loop containing nucleoside triphosphate hydrolase protein [Fomitiporia mediterranea MF3/22]EJD07069.1 P-loop containing nucleoside triphosphate hydrolase protein [Fomitiporia mediterranea MF3/22]